MRSKLILLILLATALIFRILLINKFSFPFPYDMGRDLLWAKDIAFYHIPTLIGPAASIWGVYFGALWYYLLSIPLAITNGNPVSAVYLVALSQILVPTASYFIFKNYLSKRLLIIFSIIFLFNFTSINLSSFAFHANLLTLLTLFFTYFCFMAVAKNPKFFPFTFLFASLMFHADPAPAVVFTSILIFIFFAYKLYKYKPVSNILFSAILFTIPFIPQIFFELRNSFIEMKSLVAYFLGHNPSLSGQLPLLERVINRTQIYLSFFNLSFSGGGLFLGFALFTFFAYRIYVLLKTTVDDNLKKFVLLNLFIVAVSFLIFTIVIKVEVKAWYIYGLITPLAFLVSFAISYIKSKLLQIVLILTISVSSISPFIYKPPNVKDPALFSNQLKAVNTVYADGQSGKYSVYVYTPTVYDLNYQYIYWWIGVKQEKGLPREFAYLPNQPEYVRNKQIYQQKKSSEENQVYLIIENSDNTNYKKADWINKFGDYKKIWLKNINDSILVLKLAR